MTPASGPATRPRCARPADRPAERLASHLAAHGRTWLVALLAGTVVLRLLAWTALRPAVAGDALAYLTMARAMADGGWPVDQWGQHAFYSVGYPLVLAPVFAPVFAVMGAGVAGALAVNLALAALSGALVHAIARRVGLERGWSLLAVAGHAVWLPGVWNTAQLARENLSTPLLLAIVWASLRLVEDRARPSVSRVDALLAGLCWGAAVLTGGSALPLILVPLTALWLGRRRRAGGWWSGGGRALVALAVGAALLLAPWALLTSRMVGRPVLNTNAGFNLYLGHNPAATGRFVSIADTPAGPDWSRLRATLGEVGASARLGARSRAHMVDHPARTIRLTAVKLALFWAPNAPDAADRTGSTVATASRWVEVVQYALLLALGGYGLTRRSWPVDARVLTACAVASFWAIHGVAYIIPRYRDPVMPLILVAAVVGARALAGRRAVAADGAR